ncbi:hypothetical protein GCM10011391_24950 [Pullulanibacillus camelliae]|uniref:Uncharacterized protein n=1 Tax=Pullulanibacillus camelliae TaxID=1707096 RepID=A0A8J2YIL9_9BACL|nr:hypothetical protein GCM10011391_24950 [Pullulanibacillus camelliae]
MIITGGSSGIGKGIVEAFNDIGANSVVVDKNETMGKEREAMFKYATFSRWIYMICLIFIKSLILL